MWFECEISPFYEIVNFFFNQTNQMHNLEVILMRSGHAGFDIAIVL